jgi:hypothetical protein
MSARTRIARRTVPVLLAAASVGLLAGCGPEPAGPGSDGDAAPVATEPSEPTEPSETEPVESETADPQPSESEQPVPGAGSLADALLPAADLPGFNDTFSWQDGTTTSSEPRELAGTCHRFEMTSVGAEEVAYRTYQPESGGRSTASELVAQFPDETTAARALEVLRSWRHGCETRLSRFDRVDVGELVDVETGVGQGSWYLLSYGPVEGDPDSGWFDAEGFAVVGDRIAVVRLALVGQDYNYEVGQEPMVAAVQAAVARL